MNSRWSSGARAPARQAQAAAALALLLGCVGVGGVAIAAVLWLGTVHDRERHAELAVADVAAAAARQSALEWEAVARGRADGELLARAATQRAMLVAAADDAVRASGGDGAVAPLGGLARRYVEATATEFAQLGRGDVVGAMVTDEERVDPLSAELTATVDAVRADSERTAERVHRVSTLGTVGVLLAATLLVGLLLWRYGRARRAAEQAFYDPLTGLANRILFADRLTHAHALARREERRIAVLFVDLDDFKVVNDSLGHAGGDALIAAAAERIAGCARGVDTVARIGGDEFAVLVAGEVDEARVRAFGDRLGAALRVPFAVDGRPVSIRATVGYALSDGSADDPAELMRNADLAMYAGKRQGKAAVTAYEPAMFQALAERLALESDLRVAVERGEIGVAYQPVCDTGSERIAFVEALARWEHPQRGPISPAVFIPLAEETGLIRALGTSVLGAACRQVVAWQEAAPGEPPIGVSVNVSPLQLGRGELAGDVRDALAASGLAPSLLILEITESVLGERGDDFVAELEELSELGVRLAIDDFGTGYSSLSQLARFPFDILKIDQSFVANLDGGEGGQELLRSILDLGATLGLRAVGEGVESSAQAAALTRLGCSLHQGFHLARPMSAAAASELLGRPTVRRSA